MSEGIPCTPETPTCFLSVFTGLEARGLLDFQGRRGITSVVRWNPRPVILSGEKKKTDKGKSHKGIWRSDAPDPVLPFLDFSVLPRKNPQINQGFLSPAEPTKTLEKAEKKHN